MVESQPVRLDLEPRRQPPLQRDRHVAEPDGSVTAVQERLRHESRGVGEVDEPGARSTAASGLLRQLEHHRNGAERLGEAARSRRLLADGAEPPRDRLVRQTCDLAPDPELHDHEVGPLQPLLPPSGEDQPAAPSHAIEHPTGERSHDLEPQGSGSRRTSSSTGSRSARVTSPSTSSGVYVLPPPTTETFTPTARHRTLRP